jgi:predicted HicB family RNase H-like nuclease
VSEPKEKKTAQRPERGESQIIGFRMPKPIAKAIKVEAARRQVPLNGLLAEMWELYRESKRAS